VILLLVTANVVPSPLILSNVISEAIRSTVTSVLARATRNHISENDIPQYFSEDTLSKGLICTSVTQFID
jgi:hypothetical protein